MNEMDKWNELCFILSESINSNISEQHYELKVIQAFEKLGWSQYKKEISVRESIQFGAAGRIAPDLIIKSQNKNLFVVEIKKPSANIDYSGFKDQLHSYMRMLKLNFGILIGSKIQIYSDYSDTHLNNLSLIEEYEIEYDNDKGIEFIKLFEKEYFEVNRIENLIHERIKLKESAQLEKSIKKEILSYEYQETIKNFIKSDILKRFDLKSADKIIKELSIKVYDSKNENFKDNIPRIKYIQENQKTRIKKNNDNNQNKEDFEIQKIQKRVPKWFNNPNQLNSQILIAFMNLRESNKSVKYYELEDKCKSIKSFKSNFDQMAMFGEKNHGKVFQKVNSLITLWEPVRAIIEFEYDNYKKRR